MRFFIILLVLAGSVSVANAAGTELDRISLIANAKAAKSQFESGAASWKMVFDLSNKLEGTYACEKNGTDAERTVFSAQVNGTSIEMMRFVSTGGYWFTTVEGKCGKYRPFEAPAFSPIFYAKYSGARPIFVDEAMLDGLGVLRTNKDGVATFFSDDPPTFTSVELARGVIVRITTMKQEVRLKELDLHPIIPKADLEIQPADFTDFANDPTTENLSDLAMFSQDPHFTASTKNPDVDGRLFNLSTKKFRRIPYQGYSSAPICFSADRKAIFISGTSIDRTTMRPYRIDLSTGRNQAVGGDDFDQGVSIGGSLSPDGTQLATIHTDADASPLEQQVYVIDLATNTAKAIGKTMDTGCVNWMPDGKHLLVVHKQYPNWNEPSVSTLATMDLDGNLKTLCPGGYPIPLADGKTLLFENKDELLCLCDLDGQNVRLFHNGFKGFAFPAPSPDGKRILLMKTADDGTLSAQLFSTGNLASTDIVSGPGLWTYPAWR